MMLMWPSVKMSVTPLEVVSTFEWSWCERVGPAHAAFI